MTCNLFTYFSTISSLFVSSSTDRFLLHEKTQKTSSGYCRVLPPEIRPRGAGALLMASSARCSSIHLTTIRRKCPVGGRGGHRVPTRKKRTGRSVTRTSGTSRVHERLETSWSADARRARGWHRLLWRRRALPGVTRRTRCTAVDSVEAQ